MGADVEDAINLEDFDAEIVRLAEARFAQGEPQLINALGVQLGPVLAKVKALTGMTFQEYLRAHFSNRFDIIEVKRNTSGLWPKGKSSEGAVAAYAVRPPRAAGPPRYLRWFWNAFAEPPSEGRRFFDPTERRIRDAAAPEGEDWIEIPSALIRLEEEPYNVREIHRRIEQWLADTGQAREAFEDQAAAAVRPGPAPGRSVLDAMIESLSPRQLQSVTMPLDVVAELAKRRV
jgi:hypothetical protein